MEEYDLLQCIDKGLEPFGSNVKQSIYWKMSILHNFSRNEVIENPEFLSNVIRETLGDSSEAVEESIIMEIREKFSIPEEESQSVVDAIGSAKKQIISIYTTTVTVSS